MLDADGRPVKRNFVHVEDLVDAILLALDHPRRASRPSTSAWTSRSTTARCGAYLAESRGLPTVAIRDAVSFDLARQHQGEVPARLAAALRPEADGGCCLDYQRGHDEPRMVWYPG